VAIFTPALISACAQKPIRPSPAVVPAAPPKDDGQAAKGGSGGLLHSAALEQLRIAPLASATDKQQSIEFPLPDAPNWTRVRFLTVPGLVGFRYGKDHHAVVGAFITHVRNNAADHACTSSVEQWAAPWIDMFEVELRHDAPAAFAWAVPVRPEQTTQVAILDVNAVTAKTATLLARDTYVGAWVAYPVWENACLVLGAALPARDDEWRARAVRDRFVAEVFPKLVVKAAAEPKARY